MAKIFEQPSTSSSLVLAALSWIIVFGALQLNAAFFRSSPPYTILGGFLGSFLFFFFITFIGNLKKEIKWVETLIGLFITYLVSTSVHRVSGTTSILFSIGIIYYLNNMSKSINDRLEDANTAKPQRR
ncbi:hypothetical protein SAMD00019534_069500 [Acytostelium subglobosum LB1]|uniref:hypothetical protein n=1 Tax=Acytostelium subglobosum LB1 TaxID=1410327 RepID=UPI000644EFB6|nr:hypothetical protein SAMD00019534_069500 [Acytostelium subglobosum LB1]GAM23775.1 hypothetical protein SAMD00019534_069500 [Acytostelium subglobosum LB1]|eukprot:XP_012753516.1 hypothetical protein SAMD00019534_069500 [Acytostelium subglobosum LB1]